MGFVLRWLASGLIASVIAQTALYSLQPLALHFIAFATITAILNIGLSWKVSDDARGWAVVLGVSIILGMTVLTLLMPGAWAPWL